MEQEADGGGVVVGAGAAGHRVVMRGEQEHTVAGAEVDAEVFAGALGGREAMRRERDGEGAEVSRHRVLALRVRPPLEQTGERLGRAYAANDLVDRRRHHGRRAVARVGQLTQPCVEAPSQIQGDVTQRGGATHSLKRLRAFSDIRAARSASGSPRSSATRAAVIARYAGSLRLPR